jgi:tRNA 2-thiouridine synthesizing protein B
MLHTLSVSPWHADIAAMLRLMEHGDDLLLLSDGVTAAIAGGRFLEILQSAPITLTCCKTTLTPAGWLVKLRTVSAGLAILISSDSVKHAGQLAW